MSQDFPDNYHIISENKVRVPGGCQCASCQTRMDGATSIKEGKRVPRPGDGAVCCFCGALLVYEEKLTTHIMTEDELAAYAPDQQAALKEHSEMFKRLARVRASGDKITIVKLP